MALNIKTAAELATLIPAYDGNSGGVKSFVDAVNLVKTIVPAENKAAAIQVILTKLSGKARNLFATIPDDYDGITQALISNCSEKSTSDSAKSNLNNLKLKSPSDLQNFTKQVDSLAEKLTETYITEKIPSEVAKKMSQKAAIQTLVANASNSETKIMLKVGKFTNLQEAINIMVENENVTTSTSNAVVLNATSNRNRHQNNNVNRIPQRNNNQRTNFNNRYQPRFPLNNYRNHSNHNNQYNQQQNNRNFNRFNRGFNQNYNQNRQFNPNRNFEAARMFFARQQNIPQLPSNIPTQHHERLVNPCYAQVATGSNQPNSQQNANNQQLAIPQNGFSNPNYFFGQQ
ncbi:uncharacterized protein DDB_G0289917-like [Wyeomyia smithii]|uniref:uncharacterized protein DDB_G0289917-like n=1 Tax=Wyeomyia smithii TaxID=174621 RepID=UPI0024681BBB|nr:uncharacterized protein DDB_G0289917-like [Wyeomyia smithii]